MEDKLASAIWLRGRLSGKDSLKRAEEIRTARKTLRDYITHTGPHVSPALHRAAREAFGLLSRNISWRNGNSRRATKTEYDLFQALETTHDALKTARGLLRECGILFDPDTLARIDAAIKT